MPRRRWRHKYPFLYTTIRRTSTIRTIFACFTLFPTLLWLLLASQGSPLPSQLYDARRVLIVLAHPGDESLFFSPTILRLTGRPEQDKKTRLLVLSEGNYHEKDDLGNTEVTGACTVLGIADRHCNVLDVPELQTGPDVFWSSAKIEAVVKDYVAKWAVDAIITVDKGGVTGDKNHISLGNAIVNYVSRTPSAPPAYTLTTTNIFRKYSLLADLPFTALSHVLRRIGSSPTSSTSYTASDSSVLLVNSLSMWRRSVAAVQQHGTQSSWRRHLYVVLSRYMWFNDLKLVVPGSALDSQ